VSLEGNESAHGRLERRETRGAAEVGQVDDVSVADFLLCLLWLFL